MLARERVCHHKMGTSSFPHTHTPPVPLPFLPLPLHARAGGYWEIYEGERATLTFATVRNAGHMVRVGDVA